MMPPKRKEQVPLPLAKMAEELERTKSCVRQITKEMVNLRGGKGARRLLVFAAKASKIGSNMKISRFFWLIRANINKIKSDSLKRKKRKYSIPYKTVSKIQFFLFEVISLGPFLQKNLQKKAPSFVLQLSLKTVYSAFCLENPFLTIGFSTFCSLRPKRVLLQKVASQEYCLCPHCQNVTMKHLALQKLDCQIAENTDDLIQKLLCPKDDNESFHRHDCIYGACEMYINLESSLRLIFHNVNLGCRSISWNHWERVKYKDASKSVLVSQNWLP